MQPTRNTGRELLAVAVLVPSYRRPGDLLRCLGALAAQRHPADAVVVVLRTEDAESRELVAAQLALLPQLQTVLVEQPGQVHALNQGISTIDADIIAITDDDAAPRPDWLERICAIFAADARVGGVGGRDWVHHGDSVEVGDCTRVGQLRWYGRAIGNHHLGSGSPRSVEFLKGANMSYRRKALVPLRFDTRLRGRGAQVGNDMALSLAVRRSGWVLWYDPQVAVDHYPGVRHDEDLRNQVAYEACRNAAFNQALIVSEALGRRGAWIYLLWALAIGTRSEPGLVQLLRLLPAQRAQAFTRARAAVRGIVAGWRAARC